MRQRILSDLYQVPAVFDKFSADLTVDDHGITVRIMSANLAFAIAQKPVIAHPVGDVVRQP